MHECYDCILKQCKYTLCSHNHYLGITLHGMQPPIYIMATVVCMPSTLDSVFCRLTKRGTSFDMAYITGMHLEPCTAANNLWAPPPNFVDRRAAADNLSALRRCRCCCVLILLQFSITKNSH